MRVLIVNTSEKTGGAAVAAHRLMEALNNNGVKAKMLVRDKESTKLTVVALPSSWKLQWHFLWERFCIWLRLHLSRKHLFDIDIANTGTDITKLPEFQEADIIHLHWINQGMLSLKDIRKILTSGKRVVWTMHDMWPATAICHYARGCTHYQVQCQHCRFLPNGGSVDDLSTKVWKQKQQMLKGVKNITFVTVSTWLADCALHSTLIGHFPVEVIPNVISLSNFTPMNRMEARSTLGICEPIVLTFGAARIDMDIKGFIYIVHALQILVEENRFAGSDIRLLLFGGIHDTTIFNQLPVNYTYLGYVNDEVSLSRIYSASNATISSSLYETFGQTLIEAMACGSIPVSFAGSGQMDIIDHLQTGYLADRLSAESLADGIEWAVKKNTIPELRKSVVRRYAENVVADKYITLYEHMLNKKYD